MMQEEGRDLYCSGCKNIMQGYLKRCSCGGVWRMGERTLEWLPYMARDD
jgi:hypothetical protein